MAKNTKGRNGGYHATPKTPSSQNHTRIADRFKVLIILAACWGFMPLALAEWIIKRLRLENT